LQANLAHLSALHVQLAAFQVNKVLQNAACAKQDTTSKLWAKCNVSLALREGFSTQQVQLHAICAQLDVTKMSKAPLNVLCARQDIISNLLARRSALRALQAGFLAEVVPLRAIFVQRGATSIPLVAPCALNAKLANLMKAQGRHNAPIAQQDNLQTKSEEANANPVLQDRLQGLPV
jgi:hypothetical protein